MGWSHALDVDGVAYARETFPARKGNRLDVLVDGSEALPAMAAELSRAESFIHLTGWYFSPELHLSRDDEPVIVRNLLAELAEKVDVRLLSWKGAPVPLFKPSQNDVRDMLDDMSRYTKIEAHADGCTGFTHCHHEKTIVINGRVAFVGGINLTLDGGSPGTPRPMSRGKGSAGMTRACGYKGRRWRTSRTISGFAGTDDGKVLPRPEIPRGG